MQTKFSNFALKKLTEQGEGIAVIAMLNVVDLDGDVTLPGAFGEQTVPMVPAHDWREAPIGKANIKEVGDEVRAEFKLNLATSTGRDWYEAMRFDLDHPPAKQQYSYGFSIVEAEDGPFQNRRVRFLKKLAVHEVSPVLLAAGIGTRTLAMKATAKPDKLEKAYARHVVKWHFRFLESRIERLRLWTY